MTKASTHEPEPRPAPEPEPAPSEPESPEQNDAAAAELARRSS